MNKLNSALLAASLLCVTTLAFADRDTEHRPMQADMMSAMDANGDGLISKDEFMNFHLAHWDKMPKDKDGMVAIKDMHHMHHDMMKKGCKDMQEEKED